MIDFDIDSMPRREPPQLTGWRRIPVPAREILSEDLRKLMENAVLSRGLGRSYGDSSLPPPGRPEVASTVLADRILAFDETKGSLRAEAGLRSEPEPGRHETKSLTEMSCLEKDGP